MNKVAENRNWEAQISLLFPIILLNLRYDQDLRLAIIKTKNTRNFRQCNAPSPPLTLNTVKDGSKQIITKGKALL